MQILTVVIPAYNAQQYISECLHSILQQKNYSDFLKVVVVIDGATDATLLKAYETIRGHEKSVDIFEQGNQGPASARNFGLSKARTKYITFLDADDMWAPNYLSTVLPILASDPDLVDYDAILMHEDGKPLETIKISSAPEGRIISTTPEDFLSIFRCYAWARIYLTSAVRCHPFPSGRRFEDNATTPWFYWRSRRIISIGTGLVFYRQHSSSILAVPRPNDVSEIAEAASEAGSQYKRTRTRFWQGVSYRIFQFGCRRLTIQPITRWPGGINRLQVAINGVPAPGLFSWLQTHFTLAYLLWIHTRNMIR